MIFSLTAWIGNCIDLILGAGNSRHEMKKLWKRPVFGKEDCSAVLGDRNLRQHTLPWQLSETAEQTLLELQKSGVGVWPEKLKALKYVLWQGKRGSFPLGFLAFIRDNYHQNRQKR